MPTYSTIFTEKYAKIDFTCDNEACYAAASTNFPVLLSVLMTMKHSSLVSRNDLRISTLKSMMILFQSFCHQAVGLEQVLLQRQKRMWVLGNIDITEEDEGPFPKAVLKISNDNTKKQNIKFKLSGNGVVEGFFVLDKNSDTIMVSRKIDREKTPDFAVNGDQVNGDQVNGDQVNGDQVNGEQVNGEQVNGEQVNGEQVNGEQVNGEQVNIHAFNAESSVEVDQVLKYHVKVKDINDNPPVFNQSVYKVEIPENTPKGCTVRLDKEFYRVFATDADEINHPNSLISYSLIAQKSSKNFHINHSTGVISCTRCLNYQEEKSYGLVVKARDSGDVILSSTTTVQVNVAAVNNNRPVFKRAGNFLGKVYKNDEHVIILRMSVTGVDVPHTSAWRAVYKIREGNENGNYKIETDAETNDGVLSLVKRLNVQDSPRRHLKVTVENEEPLYICSDTVNKETPAPDSIYVTIMVHDTNGPPAIHPSEVTIQLYEGQKIDSDLVKFNVTDPDDSTPNKIRFTNAYDPENWVMINAETGIVTALHEMDRESPYVNESTYRVIVHAVDDAKPPLTGTATLNILLLDVNDNKPYLASTYEQMCDDGNIQHVTLEAKDDDMIPYGGPFTFALLNHEPNIKDNWKLQPTIGYSVNLVRKKKIPIGNYSIPVIIQDRQGLVQRNTLHVWVCPCDDGRMCPDHAPMPAALGAAAIGILFGALLLLLLGLCLSFVMKNRRFYPLPAQYTSGAIANYDQEGPYMDLKDLQNKLFMFEKPIFDKEKEARTLPSLLRVPTDSSMRIDWAEGEYLNRDTAEDSFTYLIFVVGSFLTQVREDMMSVIKRKLEVYKDMGTAAECDQVTVYKHEGEEIRRGSLDSLTIVGSDSGYSFLDNLEIGFTPLARICQQKGQN
ncbi:cadherin-like protein 26 [Rhinoraja longicauda]